MIGLDRLMKIKGVVGAGQFSGNGKVIHTIGELPEDVMETAHLCVRQNQRSRELAMVLDAKSSRKWLPLQGWAVWGGEYAVVVVGNTRVFVEVKYADFNQLLVNLFGSEAAGTKPMNY